MDISVQLTYTNTFGQEKTVTSAVLPYGGFRMIANAEDGRNEWIGETVSEEVVGSVNPFPFVESYSNNGTSSTNGTSAGSAHNITAVKASDVGITAREGENVIRIYADGSKSNRSELAHLNNETSFKEGEEYYFSGSFYAPKEEWDPIVDGGSTVITQLKQYGGGSPNFELRLSNNGDYKMTWRAVPHNLDNYQDMGYAIPDAWNDLKIFMKHSQGSDGIFQVWLNNEKVIDYSGATMNRSSEGYLKFGMYTEIYDERIIYWDAIDISDHFVDTQDPLINVIIKPNNFDLQQSINLNDTLFFEEEITIFNLGEYEINWEVNVPLGKSNTSKLSGTLIDSLNIPIEFSMADITTSFIFEDKIETRFWYSENNDTTILIPISINIDVINVSIDVENDLPIEITLYQNYPNPFNPSTQIQYALPEATQITLEVFNSVGQKVMELVNGQKSAGYHTVTFDASGLSSGVYLYKLTTLSFTQTKKMLLIK